MTAHSTRSDSEAPTLERIRAEVGWDSSDDEPTDFEVLERYINALEAQVRAEDMLRGWTF